MFSIFSTPSFYSLQKSNLSDLCPFSLNIFFESDVPKKFFTEFLNLKTVFQKSVMAKILSTVDQIDAANLADSPAHSGPFRRFPSRQSTIRSVERYPSKAGELETDRYVFGIMGFKLVSG